MRLPFFSCDLMGSQGTVCSIGDAAILAADRDSGGSCRHLACACRQLVEQTPGGRAGVSGPAVASTCPHFWDAMYRCKK